MELEVLEVLLVNKRQYSVANTDNCNPEAERAGGLSNVGFERAMPMQMPLNAYGHGRQLSAPKYTTA